MILLDTTVDVVFFLDCTHVIHGLQDSEMSIVVTSIRLVDINGLTGMIKAENWGFIAVGPRVVNKGELVIS